MSDAWRKHQKRLKREQKRAQLRKQQSISPYKRLAQTTQVEACYINSNWHDTGLATITVVRNNSAGMLTLGVFLIDIWCAGLKDASARLDLGRDDVDDVLGRERDSFDLERIDIDTARDFVAAGIRFARQNGFKLPQHLDRWLSVLGGLPNINTADLTNFGVDGKLRWVGSMQELRERLIGSTPEAFIARPDVEYIVGVADEIGPIDKDEVNAVMEGAWRTLDAIEATEELLANDLKSRGITPHPRLKDGLKLLIATGLRHHTQQVPRDEVSVKDVSDRVLARTLLEGLEKDVIDNHLSEELLAAVTQARDEFERRFGRGEITNVSLDGGILQPTTPRAL